jgi:Met-10+ like-protein
MHGATGNIYCGLHEFAEMAFTLHLLRPGDLFADIGANVGSYTVLAAGVCGARVVAVEPGPAAGAALAKNIALNRLGDRVSVAAVALGTPLESWRSARGKTRPTTFLARVTRTTRRCGRRPPISCSRTRRPWP